MPISQIRKYFVPNRILDIGANIGQFHLQAKKEFPNAHIFSIEAMESCEPNLKKITQNYIICLLSNEEKEYTFYTRKYDKVASGSSIYRENTKYFDDSQILEIKKYSRMLDSVLKDRAPYDLIKIDTQGSELDIISGGLKTCSKVKGILLEVAIEEYNIGAPLKPEVDSYMNLIGFRSVEVLSDIFHPDDSSLLIQQDILYIKD